MDPWKDAAKCWYCDRDFDDLQTLVQHQQDEHFKCHICHKRLKTGPGLAVHCMQVHKETVGEVPHSLPHRRDIHIEISGMDGIPAVKDWTGFGGEKGDDRNADAAAINISRVVLDDQRTLNDDNDQKAVTSSPHVLTAAAKDDSVNVESDDASPDNIVNLVRNARCAVEHEINSFHQMCWVRALRIVLTWSNRIANVSFEDGFRAKTATLRTRISTYKTTRSRTQRVKTSHSGRFEWQLIRAVIVFPLYAFVAVLLDIVLGLVRLLGH